VNVHLLLLVLWRKDTEDLQRGIIKMSVIVRVKNITLIFTLILSKNSREKGYEDDISSLVSCIGLLEQIFNFIPERKELFSDCLTGYFSIYLCSRP
jgi:hypothetical protein